jgi:hypothetical protein
MLSETADRAQEPTEQHAIDRALHLQAIIAAAYPGDAVSIAAGEEAWIELRNLAGRDLAWVMLRQAPTAAWVALAPMLVR